MKTSAKYFHLAVRPRSSTSSQKTTLRHSQNNETHNQFFFHCRL